VTLQTRTPPTLESEALAFDLDGKPLTGCAARQVGKSPRNRSVPLFSDLINDRDAPSRYCFGGTGSTCTIVHCRSNRNVRSDPFSGSFSASASNRMPSACRTRHRVRAAHPRRSDDHPACGSRTLEAHSPGSPAGRGSLHLARGSRRSIDRRPPRGDARTTD